MKRNVEVKMALTDQQFARTRDLARQLATEPPLPLKQRDVFYRTAGGRLKLRHFADGSAELIGYRRPDESGCRTSQYVRATVADPQALDAALNMTLGTVGEVVKDREVLIVDQTRVHLDRVQGLGTFLELEVVLTDDQTPEEGQIIARHILAQLELADQPTIAGAYLDLFDQPAGNGS